MELDSNPEYRCVLLPEVDRREMNEARHSSAARFDDVMRRQNERLVIDRLACWTRHRRRDEQTAACRLDRLP